MELEDPFVYEKPEFLKEIEREKRRAARSKRLGRPIGTWGGRRKGAGTKKKLDYTHEIRVNLTRIQLQILEDMGNGDLRKGLQALINEHT